MPGFTSPSRLTLAVAAGLLVASLAAACQSGGDTKVIQLRTLNGSGVTGSVTLTDAGRGRTRVEIKVDPAGRLDMPAHIHPGTCSDLTPQPKFPLENVRNGSSMTVVPAALSDLARDGLAVNLHNSNDDLKTYTACGEIR